MISDDSYELRHQLERATESKHVHRGVFHLSRTGAQHLAPLLLLLSQLHHEHAKPLP